MNIRDYLHYWCSDTQQNFPVSRCVISASRIQGGYTTESDGHFLVLVVDEKSPKKAQILTARPCVFDGKYAWVDDEGVLYAHKERSMFEHPLRVVAWAKCESDFDFRK